MAVSGATLPNDPRQFVDISSRNYMPIIRWQATWRLFDFSQPKRGECGEKKEQKEKKWKKNTHTQHVTHSWNVWLCEFFTSLKHTFHPSTSNGKSCISFSWIYVFFALSFCLSAFSTTHRHTNTEILFAVEQFSAALTDYSTCAHRHVNWCLSIAGISSAHQS